MRTSSPAFTMRRQGIRFRMIYRMYKKSYIRCIKNRTSDVQKIALRVLAEQMTCFSEAKDSPRNRSTEGLPRSVSSIF
jgi:hypothetical protein